MTGRFITSSFAMLLLIIASYIGTMILGLKASELMYHMFFSGVNLYAEPFICVLVCIPFLIMSFFAQGLIYLLGEIWTRLGIIYLVQEKKATISDLKSLKVNPQEHELQTKSV